MVAEMPGSKRAPPGSHPGAILPAASSHSGSREPNLYLYKLPIVVVTFAALAVVSITPFATDLRPVYLLCAVAALSFFNGVGQAMRMVSSAAKIRRRLLASDDKKQFVDEESTALVGGGSDAPAWSHAFVIPNYREELEVLSTTLEHLARHEWAHTYTVVLAMEAKEAGAVAKANELRLQFAGRFAAVVYTLHHLSPEEMAGKASNVNAAVRQLHKMVHHAGDVGVTAAAVSAAAAAVPDVRATRDGDPPLLECGAVLPSGRPFMLTIMDADAQVPFQYVQQLEGSAAEAARGGEPGSGAAAYSLYAAPVLFEQSNAGVPAIVVVTDYMWSAMAAQNLNTWCGVGFPISNYSLPLGLAHSIGYWDTWPDAIGEDMHMFIKAFYRTGGACRLRPLYAPINMGHVSAPTYLGGIWARFMQAERHMRGLADTAYALHEWGTAPWSGRKGLMLAGCLEAHLVPIVTLISLVILPLYYNAATLLLTGAPPATLPFELALLGRLGQANLACILVVLTCYENIRHTARKHLYRLGDATRCFPFYICHLLSYLWLFVSVWIYTVAPVLLVVVKHALNIRSTNYIVAAKAAAPRPQAALAAGADAV